VFRGFCGSCICPLWSSLKRIFVVGHSPRVILITSMWYKTDGKIFHQPTQFLIDELLEQPPRVGVWYVGTGTGAIMGALTSFGFQHYHSDAFASWQIMFLLFCLITIAVSIIVFFFLPNNPMTSRLSREEKIRAIERLRENQTGIENKHFKRHQAIECFKDPHTHLLSLIAICSNVPNGAVSSYQATIIKDFRYTSEQTVLLSIPSGAIAIIAVLGATYCTGHFDQMAIFMVILLIPGVLGGCLMAFLPDDAKAGKLGGNYLTNFIGASLPLLY
jgi:MFS family permease